MSSWCRSCGVEQQSQAGPCGSCGTELSIGAPTPSPIGLAFEVRGRLGMTKKQGICVDVEGDVLVLHFSPKDKEPTRLPGDTPATDLVPTHLSAAGRLLYAAALTDTKLSWDRDLLRRRAAELCADVRALRRVVDDALGLDWQYIVDWAPLSVSEKAWRTAHHAATTGDLPRLGTALTELPPAGYPARGELLLPHLAGIRRDAETWRPVLETLAAADVQDAEVLREAALGPWDRAVKAGTDLLPAEARATWSTSFEELMSGVAPTPAPTTDARAWTAVSLVSSTSERLLDDRLGDLVVLDPPLLDDLVDAGRISPAAALTRLPSPQREHLLARVDPDRLDEDELRAVGHLGELARRFFLRRDRATLSGLDPLPRVLHYQALLDVIEGGRPDPDRLDPTTTAVLGLPTAVLGQLKDRATTTLPAEVAADPSLWPMFAQQAIDGALLPDPMRPPGDALNAWIGLHRLLGLVWSDQLGEAIELGNDLVPQLTSERAADEALSLLAYALGQLGRYDDALERLEAALTGEYTENLLVNASIIASRARPEVGVRYLARLVDEAPSPDLRRAALRRAISVWRGTDEPFPPILVHPLKTVLEGPLSIEDYLSLGDVAISAAVDIVPRLARPASGLEGPYRIIQARARFKAEPDYRLTSLADEFIAVYRAEGRPDWFNDQWATWVGAVRDSVFVDFGDAIGSAEFIDRVLVEAPALFTPDDRFELAPQAGAHLAVQFAKSSDWLNASAWNKFFLDPSGAFLDARHSMTTGFADYLTDNFTLCLGIAGIQQLGAGRDSTAALYNPLVERLRWDSQNRYAIVSQMRQVITDTREGPLSTLEAAVERMRRLGSTHDKRRELTTDLANDVAAWRTELDQLYRNL